MAYEPLHHKYRPQSFAELVGQGAIAQTLSNALRQRRIAPAYLFTGARGTGKTSSARIFAKSLNCLSSEVPTDQPCGSCEVCRAIARGSALDVIEIDAASNTGVDNIRELIERAQFAPVQCRYKVYVIDECHMLSTAAFNALLKTLEEPPERVVFVLATTDPQKVLPTIISRCQRFDFRRIPLEEMAAHLEAIACKEAIDIAPDALHLIAQISQGGLRDAESLLDQLSLLEHEITVERVWDLVGAVPERDLMALVQAIAQDNPTAVLDHARHLMDRGLEPLIVLQNLASFYRDLLIAKTAPQRQDLVAITTPTWAAMVEFVQPMGIAWIAEGQQRLRASEPQVKNTAQPRLWLEVTLLGLLPSALFAQAPAHVSLPQSGHAVPARSPSVTQPVPPVPSPPPSRSGSSPLQASTEVPQPKAALPPPVSHPASEPVSSPNPVEHQPDQPAQPDQQAATTHTPSPTTPPLVEQDSEQSNLQQLWLEILALVQPYSTQTMLKQQCFLIGFNGQEARVGARSQPLFKMAKDRMPNIEAAFAKRFNHPVRISLEVAASVEAQPQSSSTVRVEDRSPSLPLPSPPESPPPVLPSIPQQSLAPPPPTGDPPTPTAAPLPPSPSPVNDAETDLPPPQVLWQEEDEVVRAAKSLAQMFNGQLVNPEGEIENPSKLAELISSQSDRLDEADLDGDVPF